MTREDNARHAENERVVLVEIEIAYGNSVILSANVSMFLFNSSVNVVQKNARTAEISTKVGGRGLLFVLAIYGVIA